MVRGLSLSIVWTGAFLVAAAPSDGMDANRFFRELADADRSSERIEICLGADPANLPPFAALVRDGYLALAEGSDSIAVDLLEEAIRLKEDLAIGCVLFADYYFEGSKWEQAARWYRRARAIAPERLDPHYRLGLIWLLRGETEGAPAYEQALASMREMTRIDPASPDGWSNTGMVLTRLERYEEAEKAYRKALAAAPRDPQIHHNLGSFYSLWGKEDAAESEWRKALSIDPAQAATIVELAALFGRQGKIVEAIDLLRRGAEAAHVGPDAGRIRRDLGLLHILAEQSKEAIERIAEARILTPDARTLLALGLAKALQGDPASAGDLFREAARSDPSVVSLVEGIRPGDPSSIRSVAAALLPEWKIPEGRLDLPPPTNEAPYDTAPVPVYRALATYPDAAGGIEGTVHVKVRIDKKGLVRDGQVVSKGGNPALEYAALDAAKRWRFEPALLRGEPVEAEVTIPFRFSSRR